MSVALLIPWRDVECLHRTRALEYVTARLAQEHPAWPVVIGRHDNGPWCKALAVAAALSQTDATTLVIHDADVHTNGLPEAVQRVQDGAPWAIGHRGVHRLTEASTAAYVAGAALEELALSERAYLGVECGGAFVIRREVYEDCGLDPRFTGFGGEDESLAFALRTLHGPPWRGKAPMVHLWHPPQERARRSWGSPEGRDLRKRYARALHHETAMRALVNEARLDAHVGPAHDNSLRRVVPIVPTDPLAPVALAEHEPRHDHAARVGGGDLL